MAELTTIARPYARAAFQFAQQTDALARWESVLEVAATIVREPAMRAALDNPARGAAECAALVADASADCKVEVDDKLRNFMVQLASNKRLALLPEIARQFHQLVAERERFRDVEVVSAYEIQDSESEKLAEALRKRLALDVNVSGRVDESLIGGVVIRAGDTVIDGSVRGRLDRLAERLNSRV